MGSVQNPGLWIGHHQQTKLWIQQGCLFHILIDILMCFNHVVFEIALGVLRLFPSACIRTGPKHRQRDFELLELGLWTWPVQPQTRGWLNKVWICNSVYVLMSWPCQGTQDQGAQKHCGEAPCAKGESLNQMLELSIHCSVSIWIWYI